MSSIASRVPSERSTGIATRVGAPWAKIVAWIEQRDWDEGTQLMLFALVIGAASALGVVAFYRLIDLAYALLVTRIGEHLVPTAAAFYRPLVTALALWMAWSIVRWAKIPDGQTVPDVQLAVAKRGGVVRFRPVVVRTLAAVVTLAGGGSAGSEGPTAVLGSAIGSVTGRAHALPAASPEDSRWVRRRGGNFRRFQRAVRRRVLRARGSSRLLLDRRLQPRRDRERRRRDHRAPFLGSHPAFHIPPYGSIRPLSIVLLYPLLGIACGLASALYSRLYFATADAFQRVRPTWLRPLLGGLAVGLLVLLRWRTAHGHRASRRFRSRCSAALRGIC